MTIEEVQFPTDISYGATGGPEYSTDIVETFGGHEQRNVNWSAARASYDVSHGVKTKTQLDALIAFFRARRGRAVGFRFKDWSDYSVSAQNIGTGDGAETDFQLVKTYTSGSVTVSRTITKPVNGTVNIYLDAVLQGGGYTLDTTTGIVSFTVAPGVDVVVTSDFEFDVPVRFDTDSLDISLDAINSGELIGSWNNIPVIEVRT